MRETGFTKKRIMLLVASMATTLMMVAPAVAQEDPKDVVKHAEKCEEAEEDGGVAF
jgi:hypothetical protein